MDSKKLFKLINSLNSAEKRYFRLTANQFKEAPKYFKLFELIAIHNGQNESAIQAGFKQICKEMFARKCMKDNKQTGKKMGKKKISQAFEEKYKSANYSYEKNQLFKHLMKALRFYHSDKSPAAQVRQLFSEVEILLDKQFPELAMQQLQKAKRLSKKYGLLPEMTQSLVTERNLIFYLKDKNFQQIFDRNTLNSMENLVKLNAEIKILLLYDKVYLELQKNNTWTEQLANYEQELDDLKGKENPIESFSLRFQINYYSTKISLTQIKGDSMESLVFTKKLIDFFDLHPPLISVKIRRYIGLLNNYINRLFVNQLFEEIEPMVKKIQKYKVKDKDEARNFQFATNGQLLYLIGTKKHEEIIRISSKISKNIKKFEGRIPYSVAMTFTYYIMLAFFATRKWKQCQIWIEKILILSKLGIREDIRMSVKLAQLLILIEKEMEITEKESEEDVYKYVQNFLQLLEDKKTVHPLEYQFTKMINEWINAPVFKQKELLQNAKTSFTGIPGTEPHLIWLEWY